MLKSSSLCLCSSNLGTFWLKIEQFWPFEEISIFSNGSHLGYRTALMDNFERGPPKDHFSKDWFLSYYPKPAILPYVLFLVTAAMLVGARHHRTQF